MREIGYVRTTSRSGLIIIKAKGPIKSGTPLHDGSGIKIAEAVRVFGPVKAPYISARPEGPLDIGILGEKVYIKGDKNGKKEERPRDKRRSDKMPGMRKHTHNKGLRKR